MNRNCCFGTGVDWGRCGCCGRRKLPPQLMRSWVPMRSRLLLTSCAKSSDEAAVRSKWHCLINRSSPELEICTPPRFCLSLGVDPRTRCDRLTKAQWARIQAATVEVLDEAIVHEGSTLNDGTYRNALNEAGGYQNHHRVYDRAGNACQRCASGKIKRIVQAQRSTFFCPKCQRKRS